MSLHYFRLYANLIASAMSYILDRFKSATRVFVKLVSGRPLYSLLYCWLNMAFMVNVISGTLSLICSYDQAFSSLYV